MRRKLGGSGLAQFAACTAVLGLWLTGGAHADDRSDVGKATYEQYCSSCHGFKGKGDGPLVSFLTTKPADLTQLAKKAGGQFPLMSTMDAIDGTNPVPPHGASDMPVWGERFRRELGASASEHAQVRGKLLLITDYLRSLQEK